MKYILSLDQGTTSSRTLLIDESGNVTGKSQTEFKQIFPKPSWVEHDPNEILKTQVETAKNVIQENKINPKDIAGIAITNQRETIVPFDLKTGKPIANAIVWQCRRTAGYCNELKKTYRKKIKGKTGLEIDAYFSGPKMKWVIDNIPEAKELIREKRLRFATIDSWLIYNLTGNSSFFTDPSNASRTMVYNIKEKKYDSELLKLFDLEEWMLPKVISSDGDFGESHSKFFGYEIPIKAVLGDQQAALFGNSCFNFGDMKVTYGTGGFLLINTGEKIIESENLITTIAWDLTSHLAPSTSYTLEGSTFIAGAIIQWLRDGLGLIKDSSEVEKIATSINSNDGVYLVPALVGLGAPYWNSSARGLIIGITRSTRKAHLIRAAIESMAYQITDLIMEIKNYLPKEAFIKADGGAAKNNFLLQFQSDLLQMPVTRSKQTEATALGVGYLAGLSLGIWKSTEEIQKLWKADELFVPRTNRTNEYKKWKDAVSRSLNWT